MLLMTDIHVKSFSGISIRSYIHSLAKLRSEILKDYPYFEEPNPHVDALFLKHVSQSPETIGVLIFDNTTLIGSALGYPLLLESKEILLPFETTQDDLSSYYFFGEATLLKPYRGRGIGHHFFDARELFALQCQHFRKIVFSTPTFLDSLEGRPNDFVPMHDFWRKRGYVHHPDKQAHVRKKRLHPYSEEALFSFWIKEI